MSATPPPMKSGNGGKWKVESGKRILLLQTFLVPPFSDFIGGGVADIMDGIVVLAFEEIDLEGQDGEEFIDIAFDVLDAILLPRPDLGRDVIINGYVCPRFYKFCNLQIETRIVDQNDTVRLPRKDILFTHPHVPQYRRKMEQHGNKAHVGKVPIVAHAGTTHRRHQVAAKEPELRICVKILQRLHQVRGMEVARGFTDYQVVLHFEWKEESGKRKEIC